MNEIKPTVFCEIVPVPASQLESGNFSAFFEGKDLIAKNAIFKIFSAVHLI